MLIKEQQKVNLNKQDFLLIRIKLVSLEPHKHLVLHQLTWRLKHKINGVGKIKHQIKTLEAFLKVLQQAVNQQVSLDPKQINFNSQNKLSLVKLLDKIPRKTLLLTRKLHKLDFLPTKNLKQVVFLHKIHLHHKVQYLDSQLNLQLKLGVCLIRLNSRHQANLQANNQFN